MVQEAQSILMIGLLPDIRTAEPRVCLHLAHTKAAPAMLLPNNKTYHAQSAVLLTVVSRTT